MEDKHTDGISRGEKAEQLFLQGYNCAQAVFTAFADVIGIPAETAARVASSFGGGIGRLREFCGAVGGAEMVLGAVMGYSTPETGEIKAEHYARVQRLAQIFREEKGSYVCRELLGLDGASSPIPAARTGEYYQSRPCPGLVRCAAEITERMLREAGKL